MNGPSPVEGPSAEASTTQREAQPISSLPARKWNAGSVAQVIENAEPEKANGLSEAVDMLKRLPPVTSAAPRKKRAAAIGTLVDKVSSAVPAPMSWGPGPDDAAQRAQIVAQARPVADNLRLLREAVASLSGLTEAARSQLLAKIDALRIALPTHLVREFPMELWLKVLDYLHHQPDDPVDHAQKALGDVAALALVCQPLYDALKEEVKKESALRGASFMPLLNPDESDRFLELIRELKAEGSRIRPTATLLKAYSEGEARQIGSRELTFDMPAAVSNAVKHVGRNLEALYALLPADALEGDALLARHFGIALMKCGVDALPNALVKRLLLDPEFFAEKIAGPSPVVGFAETTPFDGISMRTLYRGLRNVCTVATLDSLAEHDRGLFARSIELVFRAGDVVLSASRMDRATMGAAGLLLPLDDKREFLKDFARSVASGAHDDCPPAETLEVFLRLCADVGPGAISVRQKGRIASAMAGRIAALLKAPAGLAEGPKDWHAAVDTLKALRRGAILDDAQSPEFLATLHAIDAAIDQLPDAALRAEAAGHESGPGAADAEPSHRYVDIQLPGALSGSVLAFQPDDDVRYGRLKDRAAALENPALCQTVFDHLRKPLVSDGADADEVMRWARNGCAWLDSVHLLRPDQRKEMLEGLGQLNFFGNSYRSVLLSSDTPMVRQKQISNQVLTLMMSTLEDPHTKPPAEDAEQYRLFCGLLSAIGWVSERDPQTLIRSHYVHLAALPSATASCPVVASFYRGEMAKGSPLLPHLDETATAMRLMLKRCDDSNRATWVQTWAAALSMVSQDAARQWSAEPPTAKQKEAVSSVIGQLLDSALDSATLSGRLFALSVLEKTKVLENFPVEHDLRAAALDALESVRKRILLAERDIVDLAELSLPSIQRACAVLPVTASDGRRFDLLDVASQLLESSMSIGPGREAAIARASLLSLASLLENQMVEGRMESSPSQRRKVRETVKQLTTRVRDLQSPESTPEPEPQAPSAAGGSVDPA